MNQYQGPWPVRNWAAQQEVSGRPAMEASSVFTATSQPRVPAWALSPVRSAAASWWVYNYFIVYHSVRINRNKVHNKCKALELSWNQLTPRTTTTNPRENCLSWNWSLLPIRLGTGAVGHGVRRGLSGRVSCLFPHGVPVFTSPLCFPATEGTSRDNWLLPFMQLCIIKSPWPRSDSSPFPPKAFQLAQWWRICLSL